MVTIIVHGGAGGDLFFEETAEDGAVIDVDAGPAKLLDVCEAIVCDAPFVKVIYVSSCSALKGVTPTPPPTSTSASFSAM